MSTGRTIALHDGIVFVIFTCYLWIFETAHEYMQYYSVLFISFSINSIISIVGLNNGSTKSLLKSNIFS